MTNLESKQMQRKPLTVTEEKMLEEAIRRHGVVYPCYGKNSFNDCFVDYPNGMKTFWFNTEDNSTHLIKEHCAIVEN